MIKSKKVFLIFNLAILLLVLGAFALAQGKDLEVKYPKISEDIKTPTGTETSLTEYIRYIFALSIRIAGFIALGVMIYGGIRYLVSGGSAGKMADARNQILGGFLGIVILLSSYLILKTINPAIVSTTLTKEPTCVCDGCELDQTSGTISNCGNDACPDCEKCGEYCKNELDYYLAPGVYLIGADEDTERAHLTGSMADLTNLTNQANPDETLDLNAKVTAIKFGRKNEEDRYCAILHEYKHYEGPARVFCENSDSVIGIDTNTGNLEEVFSVTVFQLDPEVEGKVTTYSAPKFEGERHEYSFSEEYLSPAVVYLIREVYSVKVDGSFLVLLCGEDFYNPESEPAQPYTTACIVLTKNNVDLYFTPMGMCEPSFIYEEPLFAWTESCVETIGIYKIKPMGYPQ